MLRLSMIKSGSCCFPQYFEWSNNAENRGVPLIWVWEETQLALQKMFFFLDFTVTVKSLQLFSSIWSDDPDYRDKILVTVETKYHIMST